MKFLGLQPLLKIALPIILKCMVGIFAVILIVMLSVFILNKATNRKKQ
ncbi:MAG: oxaloacetate decarboxylase [Clostridia bacterium]|nr:oxaloacetate decarboxylase [Oscillospiraceae bacterium]MBR6693799.1 oxaloacetate decarboxylase [Clostridia bacterium]